MSGARVSEGSATGLGQEAVESLMTCIVKPQHGQHKWQERHVSLNSRQLLPEMLESRPLAAGGGTGSARGQPVEPSLECV